MDSDVTQDSDVWGDDDMEGNDSVVAEFDRALFLTGGHLTEPMLLPERLAMAAASTLPVDGAGLTNTFATGQRLPIGASDAVSAAAERLQFTLGEGPCWTAQQSGRYVAACRDELFETWPVYAARLAADTGFGSVVALPLPHRWATLAALNLFFHDPQGAETVEEDRVLAVAGRISHHLSRAVEGHAMGEALGGFSWLYTPGGLARAQVWKAVGLLAGVAGTSSSASLALLRAHSHTADEPVETTAADLLSGRLAWQTVHGSP